MTDIQGVSIDVFTNGARIEVEPDGHLGRLIGSRVILEAAVAPGRPNVSAFTLDRQHRVQPKKDETPEAYRSAEGSRYRLAIPLHSEVQGSCYTLAHSNNLRLAEARRGGSVTLWEISVISQNGEFFLVAQRDQEAECFRDGDAIVCPSLSGRPQIASYLAALYATRLETLLPSLSPAPSDPPPVETFGPKRGRVLWWSSSQGAGRLLTDSGVAGVHWRNVAKTGRRAMLASGDLVAFDALRVPHDSGRPKNYPFEAVGVTRV